MPLELDLLAEVEIEEALGLLPEGEWEVWTSNSFRRITALYEDFRHGPDGGVLSGTIQHSDGHPDLSMNEQQLKALCKIINTLRRKILPESN
jgi:hypothetical protein